MKLHASRSFVAAFSLLLCSTAVASQDQLRYSELEQRMAALEAQLASQQGVKAAGYAEDAAVAVDGSSSTCGCSGGSCSSCDGFSFSPGPCGCNGGVYASFEFLWLRPHVSEDWVGKLSESMEFSSRTVIGYENCCGLGVRARYFEFDHTIEILDPAIMGWNFDVLDLEVTNRFGFRSTDVVFGGGFRYAYIKLSDGDLTPVDIDAYGLTVALDARTPLCAYCNNRWSFVYGARWSLLGGDWEGDNDIIDTIGGTNEVRDDNILVTELYAGVEYLFCYGGYDFFSRATIEMQNWRSDVLGEPEIGNGIAPFSIGSTNSLGLVGIGYTIGMMF